MKKTSLFVFCLFVISAFAQNTTQIKTEITPVDPLKIGQGFGFKLNKTTTKKGGLISIVNLSKDSTGAYQNVYKSEYTYYSNGKQRTNYGSLWQNTAWAYAHKDTLIYDTSINKITQLDYSRSNNLWNPSSKTESFFDTQNFPVEVLTYKWNNNVWTISNKIEYKMSNGHVDSIIISNDFGGGLKKSNMRSFVYDTNGYMVYQTFELWKTNAWDMLGYFNFVNNTAGLIQKEWYSKIQGTTADTLYRRDFYYNAQNLDTMLVRLTKTGAVYNLSSREIWRYNGAGNLKNHLNENYVGGSWVKSEESNNTFNLNEMAIDYFFPNSFLDNLKQVNIITAGYFTAWSSGIPSELKLVYNYSTYVGVNEQQLTGIEVYPNPVKDNFVLYNTYKNEVNLEMYSTTGKLVFSKQNLSGKTWINVKTYPSGLYTLRVYNKDGSRIIKIIKE